MEVITVEAVGDFGFPSALLESKLEPLDINAVWDQKNQSFRIVKGQKYKFRGNREVFTAKYLKNHKLAGKPAGLAGMFRIVGSAPKNDEVK